MGHVWAGHSQNIMNGRRHKKHLTLTNKKTRNGGMWRDEESLLPRCSHFDIVYDFHARLTVCVWRCAIFTLLMFPPLLLLFDPLSRKCVLKHVVTCDVTKGINIYNQLVSPNLFDRSLRLPCFCPHPNMRKVQQSITFSGKLKATSVFRRLQTEG